MSKSRPWFSFDSFNPFSGAQDTPMSSATGGLNPMAPHGNAEAARTLAARQQATPAAPPSAGDQWAGQTAEHLRGMRSENPVLSGATGAVTGRVEAVQRLGEEGLPAPTRVMDGISRMAQIGGFLGSGGLDRVTPGDVGRVGLGAARDTVENARPLEAIRRAPAAAAHAAQATHVASTMTDVGRGELQGAGRDLARNKATEVGASVATGSGLAWGMRGAAAAIPPVGPLAIGAKGLLWGGSYAVQGAGLLHGAYAASDFANRVDEHRDRSHHAASAIDDVMARRGPGGGPI